MILHLDYKQLNFLLCTHKIIKTIFQVPELLIKGRKRSHFHHGQMKKPAMR